MKKVRLLIPALILIAIIAVLTWLVMNPPSKSHDSSASAPVSISKGDDNPWDPGDEKDPRPKPHKQKIDASHIRTLVAVHKSDNPWDPGDEAPTSSGGPSWQA